MLIDGVRLMRKDLRRTDPTWRTATYADSVIAGFVLEVTAGGATGLGATAAHPLQVAGDTLEAQLRSQVLPELLGADPLHGSEIRSRIRARGVHRRALLAADLALHDLLGRLAGLPCHALWGGPVKPAVEVVRMIGLKAPDDLLATAQGLIGQGFRHLKVKIGGVLEEDLQRVALLRDHVGPDVSLEVDGNGAYSLADAIRLAEGLARYDVRILEQPVPYRDLDALRDLTAASPIPIMADQCVVDVASALDVCRRGAAHVVSVKISKMGSVEECRRIAEICEAFGVGVRVGGSAAPALVDMAQAQLALSCAAIAPQCEVGEFLSVTGDGLAGLRVVDGRILPGDAPGLGMTLTDPGEADQGR